VVKEGRVAGVHVHADRDVCIGAGMCVLTAGAVFDQDDDGIVVLLDKHPSDEAAVREAVANCPSGALSLTEEE
jgi:ferredoxin